MENTLDKKLIDQLVRQITELVLKQLPQTFELNQLETHVHKKRYMNQKEVCEYINVSAHTINNYIIQGLPIIQIIHGGRTYYDKNDVDEFMQNHKISTKN